MMVDWWIELRWLAHHEIREDLPSMCGKVWLSLLPHHHLTSDRLSRMDGWMVQENVFS